MLLSGNCKKAENSSFMRNEVVKMSSSNRIIRFNSIPVVLMLTGFLIVFAAVFLGGKSTAKADGPEPLIISEQKKRIR